MLDALRMNGLTPEIINNSYKDLTEALLNVDKRVLISIANSVWTEKNFVVKKPFTDILTSIIMLNQSHLISLIPWYQNRLTAGLRAKQTD